MAERGQDQRNAVEQRAVEVEEDRAGHPIEPPLYHGVVGTGIPLLPPLLPFLLPALITLLLPSSAQADFQADQRKHPRVRRAFEKKEAALKAHFSSKGLAFPPKRLFVRIFKDEKRVELWVKDRAEGWSLAKAYPFCYASGRLGPKRRQGDLQVPEGFYHIDRFNPWSSYHLSLGIDYPNRADRILGERRNLGGDIFIHGDCVSIGCVAITDDLIREVYVLAVLARGSGQRQIPVHIFPTEMNDEGMRRLERAGDAKTRKFWRNLREGWRWFEEKRSLPRVRVARDGRYLFSGT